MKPRLFSTFRYLQHENPLVSSLRQYSFERSLLKFQTQGLPRSGSIPRMQRGLPERRRIKDVQQVIAVSSAKGGVGKSTIAGIYSLDILEVVGLLTRT
jgi:ATP-binding protein involved in chromosome partitioning